MKERELLTQICDWLKANAYKYGKVRFTEGGLATFDLRTDAMIGDINEEFGKMEDKEVKSDSQDCATTSSKTEPMFKKGDWIVDTRDGEVFRVDKVLDNTYNVVALDGFDFNGLNYEFEKNFRIWNSSDDAKDGDVLVTSTGCIFIYRKTQYKNALAYFYAGINAYGDVVINDTHHSLQHFGPLNETHPATDIETEELFERMLNNGYEWNEKERKIINTK